MNAPAAVPQQTKGRNFFLSGFFALVALVSSYQYFSDKQMAEASLHWAETAAKVEHSLITSSRTAECSPEITYSYSVQGKSLESSTVSYPFTIFPNRDEANAFIAKYPIGKEVTAFYDPKEPSHACLVAGGPTSLGKHIWLIAVQYILAITCYFIPPEFLMRRRRFVSNPLQMIEPPSSKRRY